MKLRTVWVVVLLMLAGVWTLAQTDPLPDSPDNRMAEAQRYASVSSLRDLLDDLAENMAAAMPNREAKELKALFTEHMDVDSLERAMLDSMVRHFTAAELGALADFYGSPEGRSAMSKFGKYLADVMPAVNSEVEKALQRAANTN